MGYLGRRIGKSQDKGDSTPGGADGAVGGGILDLFASGYFQRQGNTFNAPGLNSTGLVASGGVISDYTVGSDVFRAHVFTSTGSFNVTGTGNLGGTIDYLVVGGGGGGGKEGGGGGAGGVRSSHPDTPSPKRGSALSVSAGTNYTVTIGAGGAGVFACPTSGSPAGTDGNGSHFGPGSPIPINTSGGGGGGSKRTNFSGTEVPTSNRAGRPGGSGGGAGRDSDGAGGGSASTTFPNQLGFAGGDSTTEGSTSSGGGGGAGSAGQDNRPSDNAGHGGLGVRIRIAGNPANPSPIGAPGPGSGADGTGWFAGGGGGGGNSGNDKARGGTGPSGAPEPYAGAGQGPSADSPDSEHADSVSHATSSTGSGGGGGGWTAPGAKNGGNGGSGFIVVRYKIGSTASAKATGGSISFYNSKTIHTFTNSGAFTTNGSFDETVEYLIIGGGGGGGRLDGGGGGAGAFRTATTPVNVGSATPMTVTIGAGGIGAPNLNPVIKGTNGGPSSVAFPGGTVTSDGGGGGGSHSGNEAGSDSQSPGNGSGGGAAHNPTPQTVGSGGTYGNDGGTGYAGGSGANAGGGGGGAGSAGVGNPSPDANRSRGGAGLQAPATFRDPASSVGFPGSSGTFWFAGGGGGGSEPNYAPGAYRGAGGGAPVGTSYAGAGIGGRVNDHPVDSANAASSAEANSGSGGGGGGYESSNGGPGAQGGSGIVLIAYPT